MARLLLAGWLIGLASLAMADAGAGDSGALEEACRAADAAWKADRRDEAYAGWARCLEPDKPAAPSRAPQNGEDPTRLYRLYLHYEEKGEPAGSYAVAQALIARFPRHRYAHNLRHAARQLERHAGVGFEGLRRYQEVLDRYSEQGAGASIEAMKKVIADFPGDPIQIDARFWLAERLLKEGRLPEALVEYEALLELQPDPVRRKVVLIQQANIAQRQGRFEDAAGLYQTLLAANLIDAQEFRTFLQGNRIERLLNHAHLVGVCWAALALATAMASRFWRNFQTRVYAQYAGMVAALTALPWIITTLYMPDVHTDYFLHYGLLLLLIGLFAVGSVGQWNRLGRIWMGRITQIQWAGVAIFGFFLILERSRLVTELIFPTTGR